jgi:NAD(P)-dependent dehydrogenase (short-subunit alcohol dehydrogenase family)
MTCRYDTSSKEHTMDSNDKVWLVTGAGCGLGADIARAALKAGHQVVATGRDPGKLDAALGRHERLLTVRLDITDADEARVATGAAVARFGRIDVLVNNAGNFHAGFFEKLTPSQET